MLVLVWVLSLSGPPVARAEPPRVFADPESVEPLPVGAKIPNASIRSIDGESVDLATRLADRGALLVFYRGGW
jgi:hypothetical protein